jgi:hypothetical protein
MTNQEPDWKKLEREVVRALGWTESPAEREVLRLMATIFLLPTPFESEEARVKSIAFRINAMVECLPGLEAQLRRPKGLNDLN